MLWRTGCNYLTLTINYFKFQIILLQICFNRLHQFRNNCGISINECIVSVVSKLSNCSNLSMDTTLPSTGTGWPTKYKTSEKTVAIYSWFPVTINFFLSLPSHKIRHLSFIQCSYKNKTKALCTYMVQCTMYFIILPHFNVNFIINVLYSFQS